MNTQRGFTLIEMSIVLVIIALIIGGIIMAQNIINNARLQSVITDVAHFKNATELFREKYHYLPGDFPTAETLWGSDSSCPDGDTSSPYAPRTVTCNGNGDGRISSDSSVENFPMNQNSYSFYESLRVWQHLANGRFIDGQYSGVGYSGYHRAGVNVPAPKSGHAGGYTFFHTTRIASDRTSVGGGPWDDLFPGNYGHIVQYSNIDLATIDEGGQYPILTPTDAATIDGKIDDGEASTGNVLAYRADTLQPNCTDGSDDYDTSNNTPECSLIFLTGL